MEHQHEDETLTKNEQLALDAFLSGRSAHESSAGDWTTFALVLALELGREILRARLGVGFCDVRSLERRLEARAKESLAAFSADTSFIAGDERGLPDKGSALAIDVIDGTNSFITHGDAYTVSLAVFRDGAPFFSTILNPVTGELGYASEEGAARLVQLPSLGVEAIARSLPLIPWTESKPLLVNLHPFKEASRFHMEFFSSWRTGGYDIQFVKSPGGSPSGCLLEAAKGHFVYLNIWDQSQAGPPDLVPGTHLLRSAGGSVLRVDGEPISWVGHQGVFIAGAHAPEVSHVKAIAQAVKANMELAG